MIFTDTSLGVAHTCLQPLNGRGTMHTHACELLLRVQLCMYNIFQQYKIEPGSVQYNLLWHVVHMCMINFCSTFV